MKVGNNMPRSSCFWLMLSAGVGLSTLVVFGAHNYGYKFRGSNAPLPAMEESPRRLSQVETDVNDAESALYKGIASVKDIGSVKTEDIDSFSDPQGRVLSRR